MDKRRARTASVLVALSLVPLSGRSADPPAKPAPPAKADPAADDEMLEYLGSLDSEGAGWLNYLSKTDISQVVKAKKPPAGSDPNAVKQADNNE